MPTWGNLQSLIQFGAAINAAIFTVAALREPLVAREKQAMELLRSQHDSMLANPKVKESAVWPAFHSNYLRARADFVECEASFKGWDTRIQGSAGIAAVLSIVALVFSGYEFEGNVGHFGVAVLTALAVLPSLAALGFNALIVARKLNGIRRLRSQTDAQLIELSKILDVNP